MVIGSLAEYSITPLHTAAMDFLHRDVRLKEVQKLEDHTDRIWSLAWNPMIGAAGIPPMLASCSDDKTVRIWQQGPEGSWICTSVLEDIHTRTVRSCTWSPSAHGGMEE